jgi:hypothetical protein
MKAGPERGMSGLRAKRAGEFRREPTHNLTTRATPACGRPAVLTPKRPTACRRSGEDSYYARNEGREVVAGDLRIVENLIFPAVQPLVGCGDGELWLRHPLGHRSVIGVRHGWGLWPLGGGQEAAPWCQKLPMTEMTELVYRPYREYYSVVSVLVDNTGNMGASVISVIVRKCSLLIEQRNVITEFWMMSWINTQS